MIKSYKELEIWQIGMEVAKKIYKFSRKLPKEELYGMTSQITRAAVSVVSNIAEGQQRHYKREFVQFLYQSLGSLAEIETQLMLIKDVHNLECEEKIFEKIDVLGRKIRQLIKALSANQPSSPPILQSSSPPATSPQATDTRSCL